MYIHIKEYIYVCVCVYLNHFAVIPEIQYRKSTTVQLEEKHSNSFQGSPLFTLLIQWVVFVGTTGVCHKEYKEVD